MASSKLLSYSIGLRRNMEEKEYTWHRVNRHHPCAICHHTDWCTYRVSENGGSDDTCICMRESSPNPVNGGMGGWYHTADHGYTSEPITQYSNKKEEHPFYANESELHQFYSWLLGAYPLNKKDEEYLRSCGLSNLSDYGTLFHKDDTPFHNDRVPNIFAKGIPGLFYSVNNKYAYVNTYATGIMRGIRNKNGFIIGIEIRLDDDSRRRIDDDVRYQPLTSKNKTDGKRADVRDYSFIPSYDKETLYITEGVKKGQIISEYLLFPTISIRGVTNWGKVPSDLVTKFKEFKRVIIAFDMDYKTNKHVELQRKNLIEAIKNLNKFDIYLAEWNEEFKGIDDALIAGEMIAQNEYYKVERIYSSEEASELIEKSMRDSLMELDGKMHVYAATVGAGKTTNMINIFNDIGKSGKWFKNKDGSEARVLWLTDDNYDLLEETRERFDESIQPAILMGRDRNPLSKFFCQDKDTVDKAGAAHQDIMRSVCIGCAFKDNCDYLMNTRRILESERFVIGVKSSFFNESRRLEKFDIVVVDESVTNKIYVTKEITLQDLEEHERVIADEDASDDLDYIVMFIDMLKQYIEESKVTDQVINISVDREFFPKVKYEASKYNDGHFLKLFMSDIPISNVQAYNGKITVDVPNKNVIEQLNTRTVFNLDATPSYIKLKAFSNVEIHKFRIKEYVNVYQIMGLRWSKTQLLDETKNKRMLKLIRYISEIDEEKKTTVLSIKPFISILDEASNTWGVKPYTGWYGNHTRGFNKFQDTSDNLILAGNFCRNIKFMEMQISTLRFLGIEVTIEDLIEEDSLNEMTQAAGRGRATRRTPDNPLNLFIVTGREIPFFYNIQKISSIEKYIGEQERNQQAGNITKKIQVEDIVAEYLKPIISRGILVPSISIRSVTIETGISRSVVRRVMQTLYERQLFQIANKELCRDDVGFLVDDLRLPSELEAERIGLDLTLVRSSVLNKYSPHDLHTVISTDKEAVNYLLEHPPVGVSFDKWAAFVKIFASSKELLSNVALSDVVGASRQTIATYIKKCAEHIEVYLMNKQQNEPVEPVREWDLFENEWLINKWVEDCLENIENESVLGVCASACGIDKHNVYSYLFDKTIDLNQAVDYLARKESYQKLKSQYERWLEFMKRC